MDASRASHSRQAEACRALYRYIGLSRAPCSGPSYSRKTWFQLGFFFWIFFELSEFSLSLRCRGQVVKVNTKRLAYIQVQSYITASRLLGSQSFTPSLALPLGWTGPQGGHGAWTGTLHGKGMVAPLGILYVVSSL